MAGLVGKVRAAVERLALWRQEHAHRPTAAAGHVLHGSHIDGVEVGPLLAIDLDGHEICVQEARRALVLERLALHHMAPVARRIADRQEDRLVLSVRPRQSLRAPWVPVDRVVRVLEQVGAGLAGESVRMALHVHRSYSRVRMSLSSDTVSTRPLLDKLGVRANSRIALVGAFDADFLALLRGRTEAVEEGIPAESVDLIFLAAESIADLALLAELRARIVQNGAIWIVSRKGKQATIRDTDVIAASIDAGLVDNKVVSFSPTHTSLRAVIRLRDRH